MWVRQCEDYLILHQICSHWPSNTALYVHTYMSSRYRCSNVPFC